nr:ribonuclease H-like domain-containing protein [Tanacetum cinerariifolium]
MKMEHYLSHTDYLIKKVIQNGNGPVFVTTDTNVIIKVLPLKLLKRLWLEKERKARTILLMALPEDHLEKFLKMADAKEIWKAIKSRFGGNDESRKMQKYLLKQQFEGFSVSALEVLHKRYDRFQTLLSQLEIHGTNASSSNIQNVAFVSADNTSSTNDDDSKALVTIDGEDIDSSGHVEEDTQNYAMIAYFSSNSGSDNE